MRETQWLTLEEIHWRLSALPAFCAGFKDRGFLREGAPADIVIYDFEKLGVRPVEIVHDLPGNEWRRVQRAEGYRHILVNGADHLHEAIARARRRASCCATAWPHSGARESGDRNNGQRPPARIAPAAVAVWPKAPLRGRLQVLLEVVSQQSARGRAVTPLSRSRYIALLRSR